MALDPSINKTGAAVPSDKPLDIQDDALVFDTMINDTSGQTVLDRKGVERETYFSAISKVIGSNLGAYALPNKTYTSFSDYTIWLSSDGGDDQAYTFTGDPSLLPYDTNISLYADPNDDPNLTLNPLSFASIKEQADNAAQSSLEAASSAQSASDDADRAEQAVIDAATAGDIYPTVADGIAATTDGDLFLVQSTINDEFARLFLNDSGVGVWQGKASPDIVAVRAPKDSNGTTFTRGFINLIDPSDPEYGADGKFNGNFIDGFGTYQHSGLISCKPGDIVSMTNVSPTTFAVFNSDMVQLNTVSTTAGLYNNRVGTIPATAGGITNNVPAYFAVNWLNASLGTVMAGFGDWVDNNGAFEPFEVERMEFTNQSLIDFISEIPLSPDQEIDGKIITPDTVDGRRTTYTRSFVNLIDPSDPEYGQPGFFNGTSLDGLATHQHSGLIAVKPGDKVIAFNNRPQSIGLFNSDQVQINSLAVDFPDGTYTIPATSGGAANNVPAYCAANWLNAELGNVTLGFGDWRPDEFTAFEEESAEIDNQWMIDQIQNLSTKLEGKKWAYLGDSITARGDSANPQNGYPDYILQKYNMVGSKHAQDGAHMSKDTLDPLVLIIAEEYLNVPLDADFITVAAGTNDSVTNMGDIDSTDITTFYGACNTVAEGLLQNHPNARIGFFTILPREYAASPPTAVRENVVLKRNAIREVCEKWALPCLDIYANSHGLNPYTPARKSSLMSDGLHPDPAGYVIYQEFAEEFLKSL